MWHNDPRAATQLGGRYATQSKSITELCSSSAAVVTHKVNLTQWCSSSVAVVSHKVNLTELRSSSAAVVPHKVNLTELCSSSPAVVPQSISTEMWSSAAPFHLDLWYFQHRTNKHLALCYLFGKTYKAAHSSTPQVTEINELDQITEKVIDVSTRIPLRALMIHL